MFARNLLLSLTLSTTVELGTRKSIRIGEVFVYGRLKMQCSYVARITTKCPPTGGACLLAGVNCMIILSCQVHMQDGVWSSFGLAGLEDGLCLFS